MSVENTVCILGGIVIAGVSGAVGKVLGSNGKVHEETCEERRLSCTQIIGTKIDNLTSTVSKLERAVNNKLLGL
jgi:hypothetical protein